MCNIVHYYTDAAENSCAHLDLYIGKIKLNFRKSLSCILVTFEHLNEQTNWNNHRGLRVKGIQYFSKYRLSHILPTIYTLQ